MTDTQDTPVLATEDLSVVHRARGGGMFDKTKVYALTSADVAIHPGETVGIVGESGCGKSTLAKAMVGLQAPTSGRLLWSGEDVWAMSAARRRETLGRGVGMIFQDPAGSLNRRMSVSQIIRDPLDVHRWKDARDRAARVSSLMELVGLPQSLAGALPGQLSGGQRQRVSIARALALEPSLIVADEPTSALDVSVRAQILNLLMDLKNDLGLAMVFVSHDIQTVKRISDRIVSMYLGRVVEETPAALLHDGSRHPYTRALFSATPSLLDAVEPIPLVGPVPSATAPPSGCPFRTRCWRADDICAQEMPPVTPAPGGHQFRCHHPIPEGTSAHDLLRDARSARHEHPVATVDADQGA